MNTPEYYMQRCLELAEKGRGCVAPNPLVGCVIVHAGKIIGEGWHERFGQAHAEVNAIAAVQNKALLPVSTLYVNLEPCTHFGKTPPCCNLILEHQIREVVIGCTDYSPHVNGKGIALLRASGVHVTTGILEKDCHELNKRFFTFYEKKRPYIILKWAETGDGFTDWIRKAEDGGLPLRVSGTAAHELLHEWRWEEQAILIGTNTALLDNPKLTVRGKKGGSGNPLRILIDQWNRIPETHHLKDGSTPTLIFSSSSGGKRHNLDYVLIHFSSPEEILIQILLELFRRNIQSVLVEGGSKLLNSFLSTGLWDEARVFINPQTLGKGFKAPAKPAMPFSSQPVGEDELHIYKNVQK
jgi:diaminohydroxyphosphoribosylaminopyrimidine deaminase/5-amino-6-(5-phosphoribosylamino)uracil reductase